MPAGSPVETAGDEVAGFTAERGIAFLPFLPIAVGGHAGADGPVAEVARVIGATPARTAQVWLLHRSPDVLPLPGTGSAGAWRRTWALRGSA
ncbi:hypothetical protein [Streptomyces sp. CB01881]|uniref:hypothetical protein n=1 Tax=Streptomyces sp. CB01881 TaxID=2078691 RepID=UPI000CDBDC40|nr:hypothetical protein [Streptomyces sp. CB01881]AUY50974.1 hypothetical protein C2142_20795 [Streptomyces sp. CB01881]TYC74358.1 hypothetical protein EH183_20760 [Streptomyces sp. CB01881]